MEKELITIDKNEELTGKRVVLRADFNEEMRDGRPVSDFKIRKTLPTISLLLEKGAQIVILSHHSKKEQTLKGVAEYLAEHFSVSFISDVYDKDGIDTALADGKVVLCENLRFWEGEKGNDVVFAKYLASLGEVYVNDAFGVSHREHASIVLLPDELPSYAGLLMEEELRNLTPFLKPETPSLLILGGAKAKNKLSSVPKLLSSFDEIFVGGALANHFFKEKGFTVGKSLLEEGVDVKALLRDDRILLPSDVRVSSEAGVRSRKNNEVLEGEKILDIGEETTLFLREKIEKARSVVCAGPLGMYDDEAFAKGTRETFDAVRKSNAQSLVGGGDTARFIFENDLAEGFTFISTGGGTTLAFLSEGTLPGIEALKR